MAEEIVLEVKVEVLTSGVLTSAMTRPEVSFVVEEIVELEPEGVIRRFLLMCKHVPEVKMEVSWMMMMMIRGLLCHVTSVQSSLTELIVNGPFFGIS